MLCFHYNNGCTNAPQYYVIRTLPVCYKLYKRANSFVIFWQLRVWITINLDVYLTNTLLNVVIIINIFILMFSLITFLWRNSPNWGLGHLIVDVSKSHTHPVGLLWTSDQLVAEVAQPHNKHKARTSLPSAGFEPAFLAKFRLQTCALDRTATRISCYHTAYQKIVILGAFAKLPKAAVKLLHVLSVRMQ